MSNQQPTRRLCPLPGSINQPCTSERDNCPKMWLFPSLAYRIKHACRCSVRRTFAVASAQMCQPLPVLRHELSWCIIKHNPVIDRARHCPLNDGDLCAAPSQSTHAGQIQCRSPREQITAAAACHLAGLQCANVEASSKAWPGGSSIAAQQQLPALPFALPGSLAAPGLHPATARTCLN